jgi:hypothetical protein
VILFPGEWRQTFGVNLTSAVAPELGARFRYHERIRPQPSFSKIVARALASDPEFRPRELGEVVRVVTVEGEYGAWVVVTGQREGLPAMRYIGSAFLDDFATVLDVIAIIPKHFARVERLARQLVRSQRFAMARRPRRFFYVPPVGWHGISSGLTANWYPLDFPQNLTNIVVPPAHQGERLDSIDEMLVAAEPGFTIESSARDTLTAASGHRGAVLHVTGRRAGRDEPIHRDVAMFVVPPHVYRMRLETTNARALLQLREIFYGVAGSFQPLPGNDETRSGQAFARVDAFDHWAM